MNNTTLQDVSPAVENTRAAEEKQEFRFVGNMRRVPGQTLFEFNTFTHELRQADIKHDVSVGLNGDVIHKTRATAKKDCIYFQALNRKNACKKLIKMYHLRELALQKS